MTDYRQVKKQLKQQELKLAKANDKTNKLDNSSKDINEILDNLKPTKINKNNMLIKVALYLFNNIDIKTM